MALPEDCNLPTPLPALSREELSKRRKAVCLSACLSSVGQNNWHESEYLVPPELLDQCAAVPLSVWLSCTHWDFLLCHYDEWGKQCKQCSIFILIITIINSNMTRLSVSNLWRDFFPAYFASPGETVPVSSGFFLLLWLVPRGLPYPFKCSIGELQNVFNN